MGNGIRAESNNKAKIKRWWIPDADGHSFYGVMVVLFLLIVCHIFGNDQVNDRFGFTGDNRLHLCGVCDCTCDVRAPHHESAFMAAACGAWNAFVNLVGCCRASYCVWQLCTNKNIFQVGIF